MAVACLHRAGLHRAGMHKAGILLAGCLLLCACGPRQPHGIDGIAGDPQRFAGKRILLSGCLYGGRHGSALYDCASAPPLVGMGATDRFAGTPGWRRLASAHLRPPRSRDPRFVALGYVRTEGGRVRFEFDELLELEDR